MIAHEVKEKNKKLLSAYTRAIFDCVVRKPTISSSVANSPNRYIYRYTPQEQRPSTDQSNHPPAVLKNIPLNINKRLTAISSSKEIFDESIAPYQKALTESGYNYKLTYNPPQEQAQKNKRKRTRNITWYNPPFNSNIKTNLGRKFLHIVDRCFPKHHPLHKIFN